ncbi:MAG: Heme peroxidase, partial [Variovorax sp.]
MNVLDVKQTTPEWLAARAASDGTASEAPAALGVSKYMTRTELLKQKHTGLAPEVNTSTQRLFDRGHASEDGGRKLAEDIIGGGELYPVTASLDIEGLNLLASLDGTIMTEEDIFEHKLWNEELAANVRAATLEPHYTVQMDQQLLVSGARRCLFMTSDGTGDPEKAAWCWYESSPEKFAALIAGWKQFHVDLAAYVPPAIVPAVVAAPVQALPSVSVQVTGSISINDNFAAFEVAVRDFLEHRLIREPKTDQDFADLDVQIKAMKGAEAALKSAEAQMLAQIETVDTAKKTKDMLLKLVSDNRLMAEKLLASEKERRRGEIVTDAAKALASYVVDLSTRYMPAVPADFAGAIKGKKSLASMEDAVSVVLANAKIEADAIAGRIKANLATLRDFAAEHAFLFPDTASIVQKAPEDLTALVKSRIAEHNEKEAKRIEAERERIRLEELQRIEREQAAAATRQAEADKAAAAAAAAPAPAADPAPAALVPSPP